MKSFLETLRRKTPRQVWDQGVELARSGAVQGDSQAADEIVLRVALTGGRRSPTVVLYPKDGEWDCDCGQRGSCSHVVAAALAVQRSVNEGAAALPSAQGVSRVRYELSVEAGRLLIERILVAQDGSTQPLRRRLSKDREQVIASAADLALDLVLTGRPTPAEVIPRIFTQLAEVPEVLFNGRPFKISSEPIPPRVLVRDAPGGVELVIDRDPMIAEVVAEGVGRVEGTLHPLCELDLTGPKLEALPFIKPFKPAEFGLLCTELLPSLSQRVSVDVTTQKLPGVSRSVKPRVLFDVTHDGDEMQVLATIVYGDPVQARLHGQNLVHVAGDIPLRDRGAERRLIFELRDQLNVAPGHRVVLSGREAISFAERLSEWSRGRAGIDADLFADTPLAAEVTVEGDRFDVSFRVGARRADTSAVLRAWRAGLHVAPLIDGGFARVPEDFLERHGDLVASLVGQKDETGKLPRFAMFDLASLCQELDYPAPPGWSELRPLFEAFRELPEAPLPADLRATLRPYQRTGVNWLNFLESSSLGGVLADDMGLGKTVQALCALKGRSLVICPTSVLPNWHKEAARFRPGLSVHLYHGPGRSLQPADLTLTTYALLRTDQELLTAEQWDTVVLDEAQFIKNPDSQVAQAAYRLKGRFRLTMTGTPIENRLDELWSQFHFVNPGLLGGRSDFRDTVARPIAEGDGRALERLRTRIRPFILRRLKQEVAPDLPPRTEAVRYCELTTEERAVYDAVLLAARTDLRRPGEGGKAPATMAILEALLRLRQASCHGGLLPGQTTRSSSKIELLLELLEDIAAEGHKALVFSQWTSLLDLVEPALAEHGLSHERLDGSTVDRAGVVDRFQAPSGPPILLLSLKAGGTGLNLTAADHVILLDPWWNPQVEAQAADRAHRIGQNKPVFIYRLVAKDTVEERILALQAEKRALFDAAMTDTQAAARLTREDLLALLDA